ncbi:hypothetical protein HN51_024148 [Arachis hypogaea]|nr:galectin-3 [Arachis hypogaea]QHO27158.1 uncharacterized protein DS421_7g205620 [Arachis hypogaea]
MTSKIILLVLSLFVLVVLISARDIQESSSNSKAGVMNGQTNSGLDQYGGWGWGGWEWRWEWGGEAPSGGSGGAAPPPLGGVPGGPLGGGTIGEAPSGGYGGGPPLNRHI